MRDIELIFKCDLVAREVQRDAEYSHKLMSSDMDDFSNMLIFENNPYNGILSQIRIHPTTPNALKFVGWRAGVKFPDSARKIFDRARLEGPTISVVWPSPTDVADFERRATPLWRRILDRW